MRPCQTPLTGLSWIRRTAYLVSCSLVALLKVTCSSVVRSWLRLVKVFRGGHTVTRGNLMSAIGRVSMVVVTGLSAQSWIELSVNLREVSQWPEKAVFKCLFSRVS